MTRIVSIAAAMALGWAGSAIATVMAADMPPPLAAAIETAKAHDDFRASFTLTASAPGETPLVMRYDAPSDSWSVLEGSLDGLDEKMKAGVEEMKGELSEPGELTYNDIEDSLGNARLVDETDAAWLYAIDLASDDMPDAVMEALTITLSVDKAHGHVARFQMKAEKPFKPMPVAKIETMLVQQDFAPLPDGPAVLTRFHNHAAGNAMFRDFDEQFTLELTDFVPFTGD